MTNCQHESPCNWNHFSYWKIFLFRNIT